MGLYTPTICMVGEKKCPVRISLGTGRHSVAVIRASHGSWRRANDVGIDFWVGGGAEQPAPKGGLLALLVSFYNVDDVYLAECGGEGGKNRTHVDNVASSSSSS